MADVDLVAVAERHQEYRLNHSRGSLRGFACCSAHACADDIPALMGYIRELERRLEKRDGSAHPG